VKCSIAQELASFLPLCKYVIDNDDERRLFNYSNCLRSKGVRVVERDGSSHSVVAALMNTAYCLVARRYLQKHTTLRRHLIYASPRATQMKKKSVHPAACRLHSAGCTDGRRRRVGD